jgi:RND family efflux transporter MFP subunit
MNSQFLRKIGKVMTPVLVLAGGIGAYSLLHAAKPEPEKGDNQVRPISVRTAPAALDDTALQVVTQGEVRARTEIEVVAQVSGRIVSVSGEFIEGGSFSPGAPLMKIEDADYRLALSEAHARVAEANLGVEQALADADVARKQLRNDADASNLALKKPQVAQARARLEAAQAGLQQAQLNLDRTTISLPFHGRLISTAVDVGQFIIAGTPIGRAFGTDVVEVRLPLNNAQLAALGLPIGYKAERGQGLAVDFSARVAGDEHHWNGRLTRLDASMDPSTRTLYAIAEVEAPYGDNVSEQGMPMAVGLFVNASIEGRAMNELVSIPAAGLRAGDVVFLISEEGRLLVRSVDVAHNTADRAVIASGLEPGDRVVTSPIRNPIQGMALSSMPQTQTASN